MSIDSKNILKTLLCAENNNRNIFEHFEYQLLFIFELNKKIQNRFCQNWS